MGYIEIPAINIDLPIYHGTTGAAMEKGAGHMEGTSLPVGGVGTHAVISAHSGMASAKLFTDLDKLEIGDIFIITVCNQKLAYEVDNIAVVEPTDIDLIRIDTQQDYVTLLTCTPYGVNTHRLLVRGHRVDMAEEAIAEVEDIEDITKNRFRDYCGEIVKYDSDLISEKILNHPTVIMTSNDIQTIKPEYSKRIYYSIVDAQLTNVVAASQHKKMVECRNKIGTSFYREYLKRIYPKIVEMLNDMENYVFDESSSIWEPDIFNLSSKVIISIYEDCKIQIPPYVTEVSYADYFGHNSLTQSVKEKIIFEWAHNRKAFKVLRKQNRLEYVAGEKAYEAVNICQALPEELIPKQSGAKVVLKLDSAEKFFGIHFKNRLF